MGKLQRVVKLVFCVCVFTVFTGCSSGPQTRSTGEYVDDKSIKAKVETNFAKEPDLKATQIHVETYAGVVQLSGFVDSVNDIQKAGQVASGVAGVKSVINNLVVRPVQAK